MLATPVIAHDALAVSAHDALAVSAHDALAVVNQDALALVDTGLAQPHSTTSSSALTTLALVKVALAQRLALHDALAVSAHDALISAHNALALVDVAPNPCSNDFLSFVQSA